MVIIVNASESWDLDSKEKSLTVGTYITSDAEQSFLTALQSQQNTQKDVDKAVVKAAKNGWLKTVIFLTTKNIDEQIMPTQERINWALNSASKGNHLAAVEYLLQLPEPLKPDQNGVNWALNSAVNGSHLLVIEALLTPKSEQINPNLEALNKALRGAIRNGDEESVDQILNNVLVTHQKQYQPLRQNESSGSQEFQSIVDFLLAPHENRHRLSSLVSHTSPDEIPWPLEYYTAFTMPSDAVESWNQETITSEEALIINSAFIIKTCLNMFENPQVIAIVTDLLPSQEKINSCFDALMPIITQQIHAIHAISNATCKFKISQAQKALMLLNGDESIERHAISSIQDYQNYQMQSLPNIRQAFILAYRLMTRQFNLENFVKLWLVEQYRKQESWQEFQAKTFKIKELFPTLDPILRQADIGSSLAMDEAKGSPFIKEILRLLNGESDFLVLPPKEFKALTKALYSYLNDQLNPLIEALFMIMRGHNKKLTDITEPNRPACARGAYVGILKAIGEIPDFQGIAENRLAGLEIIECGHV